MRDLELEKAGCKTELRQQQHKFAKAKREPIENFIKSIAEKLPDLDLVRMDNMWISGRELKLCGFKHFNNQPLEDDAVYTFELPVYKGQIVKSEERTVIGERDPNAVCQLNGEPLDAIPKPIDHNRLMREAWLRYGLPGIFRYLAQYLTEAQMTHIKNHFMRVWK